MLEQTANRSFRRTETEDKRMRTTILIAASLLALSERRNAATYGGQPKTVPATVFRRPRPR